MQILKPEQYLYNRISGSKVLIIRANQHTCILYTSIIKTEFFRRNSLWQGHSNKTDFYHDNNTHYRKNQSLHNNLLDRSTPTKTALKSQIIFLIYNWFAQKIFPKQFLSQVLAQFYFLRDSCMITSHDSIEMIKMKFCDLQIHDFKQKP